MTIKATIDEEATREKPCASWEALAGVSGYKPRGVARAAGISLRTLQRHFASRYQLTLRDWLKEVRMREAYQRLLAGDTIKEVSIDLGYKQLSHFSRDFRAFFGVPPSLFCAQHKKNRNFPLHLSAA